MEKTSKKLIGVLIVVMFIATIGAVIVSAQTEDSEGGTFWGRPTMCGYMTDLTEEQREELRQTIQEKLEEYGIEMPTQDEILAQQIEHTRQRLNILEREQELREEGKSWEEIREIIQDEFDIEVPNGEGQGMMFRHGFRPGGCMSPPGFPSDEESDL